MLISATDIIKKTISLYRENFRLFLWYYILINVVVYIPVILFATLIFGATVASNSASLSLILSIVSVLILTTAIVMSIILGITMTQVVAKRYQNQTVGTVKQEFIATKPVFWSAIGAMILSGLAILGGFILLIIPGIIFSIWFAFSSYAAVIDGHKAGAALSYSKSLVRGRWFEVFWRLFVPGLFVAALYLALDLVVGIPSALIPKVGGILSSILTIIGNILLGPLAFLPAIILYIELKRTPVQVTPPAAPAQTM